MTWLWGLAYVLLDLAICVGLVVVLCRRDYTGPGTVDWAISRRRRRRWYLMTCALAAAYLALSPAFLYAFIRSMKGRRPAAPTRAALPAAAAPAPGPPVRAPALPQPAKGHPPAAA